ETISAWNPQDTTTDPLTWAQNTLIQRPPEEPLPLSLLHMATEIPGAAASGIRKKIEEIPGIRDTDRSLRGPGDLTPLDYGELAFDPTNLIPIGHVDDVSRAVSNLPYLSHLVGMTNDDMIEQGSQLSIFSHDKNS